MSHGFIIRWSAHYKTTAQRSFADLFLGMGKRVAVKVTLICYVWGGLLAQSIRMD